MQKAKVILLSLLVAACSVFMLPGIAISGNGGEQMAKNGLQLGVGYDFLDSDMNMTNRSTDPSLVPYFNANYEFDFQYGAKYVYVKYGILDWLEVGGRIGLLGMEHEFTQLVGSDDGSFETDGEFEWGYWGLQVKARIYESQSGFFTTVAFAYERGSSDNVSVVQGGAVPGFEMQFDLLTGTLIAGWKFPTITPYAGVGYSDLELEVDFNPVLMVNTDEYENDGEWTGILGVNIHIIEPVVLTIEGALGSDIGSVSAQLGYNFL